MKNGIEAMITDITATTAEAEDYTGEDGLLYCGKCHTPKEAYFAEGKTCFGRDPCGILHDRPQTVILQRERLVSGVTATRQSATASGQPVKSSKPPKADRSTLKKWRT